MDLLWSKNSTGQFIRLILFIQMAYRNLFNKTKDEMDALVQQSGQTLENLNRSDKKP